MKKKTTITSIDDWSEYDNEIWDAITEYIHNLHGNDGHIQYVQTHDEIAYFARSCKRLHNKDEKKDE